IEGGNLQTHLQPLTDHFKKAPKIFTEDCRIHFEKTVDEVFNLIRGLSPYPAAFTMLNGKVLKIFRAKKIHSSHGERPGTPSSDQKTFLRFYCSDGWIEATEVQLEGKKKMTIEEFMRGHRVNP
ncbi:MAG: methionyl-tRNA formyltransferase, partial [Chitinophagales bacterium]